MPSTNQGAGATFVLTVSDPDGHADIEEVHFIYGDSPTSLNGSCAVQYLRDNNAFYIWSDAGAWSGPYVAGSAFSVSSQRCTLTNASVAFNTVTKSVILTLPVTLNGTVAGPKPLHGYVWDAERASSTLALGSYNYIVPQQVPSVGALTPNLGSTNNPTFSIAFSDPQGASDIAVVDFLIGATQASENACYVQYRRAGDSFYLMNNFGSGWIGPVASGAGSLSNKQCSITTPRPPRPATI